MEYLVPMALSVIFALIKSQPRAAFYRRALIKLRDELIRMNLEGPSGLGFKQID